MRLQRVDALNGFTVGFQQAVVAAAEDFGQDVGGHKCEAALHPSWFATRPKSLIEYGLVLKCSDMGAPVKFNCAPNLPFYL